MRIAGSETVARHCPTPAVDAKFGRVSAYNLSLGSHRLSRILLDHVQDTLWNVQGRTEHGLDVAEPRLSDESMNGVRMEPQVVDEVPGRRKST